MNREQARSIANNEKSARSALVHAFGGCHPLTVAEALVIWAQLEDCPPCLRPRLDALRGDLKHLPEFTNGDQTKEPPLEESLRMAEGQLKQANDYLKKDPQEDAGRAVCPSCDPICRGARMVESEDYGTVFEKCPDCKGSGLVHGDGGASLSFSTRQPPALDAQHKSTK